MAMPRRGMCAAFFLLLASAAQAQSDFVEIADAPPVSRERVQWHAQSVTKPIYAPVTIQPLALGEVGKDVVYTPIAPCRVFDTRTAFGGQGPLLLGTPRSYNTVGNLSLGQQGGNAAGCGIPLGAAAVQLQMSPILPIGLGWITGNAQGQPINPAAALFTYNTGDLNTASIALVLNQANGQFTIQANNTGTNLVGDAVGYFRTAASGTNGAFEVQVGNQRALRLELGTDVTQFDGAPNVIAGSAANSVGAIVSGATIAGGGCNGGAFCSGVVNRNRVEQSFGAVGGGSTNSAGFFGVIAGGFNNATGNYGSVPGGVENFASGNYSFAAGRRAFARNAAGTVDHHGVFVWADSNGDGVAAQEFNAVINDEFAARARGGFRFRTAGDLSTGCNLPAGSGTFACTSDRAAKEDFAEVDALSILERVAAMPIQTWRYRGEAELVRHLGPTAQDFVRAFALGYDDKTIATVDADGVALAAIQGLNQKLIDSNRAKDAEIATLKRELAAIKEKLGLR